jgi:hypothetical protein
MALLLDGAELEAACPRCVFFNRFYFRQVRLRDVIICRGCKCNIRLEDHMNRCRKAARRIEDSLDDLARTLSRR